MPYSPGPSDNDDSWDSPTQPAGRRGGEEPTHHAPLGVFGPNAPTQVAPRRSRRSAPQPADQPLLRAAPPTRRVRSPRQRIVGLVALLLLLALIVSLISFANRALTFGSAISSQAPLTTQTGFMSGMGRVNVLVLGYVGVPTYGGPYLTDSMMVISFMPGDHATTLISTPRDLWVQVPPNSGNYSKLNSAYANGYYNGYDRLPPGRLAAGAEADAKVSEITGLSIPYFISLDFAGFSQLVDAVGGVDINVPTTIVLDYPGSVGWVKQFNKGPQHMDGKLALEYARARHVLSPASQGTDFARAARQQQLIRAIIDRLRNPTVWPSLPKAMDALQKTLYSNLSLADLSALGLKLDLNHATHIGLTTSNVLVNAVSNDGQDILLPENGDWSVIPRYIDSHLKQ